MDPLEKIGLTSLNLVTFNVRHADKSRLVTAEVTALDRGRALTVEESAD